MHLCTQTHKHERTHTHTHTHKHTRTYIRKLALHRSASIRICDRKESSAAIQPQFSQERPRADSCLWHKWWTGVFDFRLCVCIASEHTQTCVLVCVCVWNRRWKSCPIPRSVNWSGASKTSRHCLEQRMTSLNLSPTQKAQLLMTKSSSGWYLTWTRRLKETGECISNTFMFMIHLLLWFIYFTTVYLWSYVVLNHRPQMMRHWWKEIQKENPGKYTHHTHDWFQTTFVTTVHFISQLTPKYMQGRPRGRIYIS